MTPAATSHTGPMSPRSPLAANSDRPIVRPPLASSKITAVRIAALGCRGDQEVAPERQQQHERHDEAGKLDDQQRGHDAAGPIRRRQGARPPLFQMSAGSR